MAPSGKQNIDRLAISIVATNVTGTGAQGAYFQKDPVPLRQGEPGSFFFGLSNVTGAFTGLVINIEFSPFLGADEYWEVIESWTPLANPTNNNVACAESGYFRLNVTTFTGGTSFNVWATVANGAAGSAGGSAGPTSDVDIHDSNGADLISNGSGALQVAVVSGGGSNDSVGLTGATAPTSATEVGFIDGSGNLVAPSSSAPLPVTVISGGGSPDVNLIEVGGAAIALGQTTMADSLPVTLASDQSPLAVTGTVTADQGTSPWVISFSAPQHVIVDSGAITVSGTIAATQSGSWTVTANAGTGTFTTEDVADGAVTAPGGTAPAFAQQIGFYDGTNFVPVDAANPLPVTGGGGGGGNDSVGMTGITAPTSATEIGYIDDSGNLVAPSEAAPLPVSTQSWAGAGNSPLVISIGTSTTTVLNSNTSRKGCNLVNMSLETISLAFGAAAVLYQGVTLGPGGTFWMDAFDFTTNSINAISTNTALGGFLGVQEYQ